MKVLQINAVNKILSTGRTSSEMADYLNQNGHQAYIAHQEGPNYIKQYIIGNVLGSKIHALLSRITGLQGYFSVFSTRKLIRYIKKENFDIVHLRNLHANYINTNRLLKFLGDNNIPTVITLHDCWFYTGRCCHYTFDNCYQWIKECKKCVRLKKDNVSWFFDRSRKMWNDKKYYFSRINSLAVIGVSDWITNEAKKSFLKNAKIVERIYNWIDMDLFKLFEINDLPQKKELIGKFVILGVASKWSNNKGIAGYIELAASIPEDCVIVLIGEMADGVKLPPNIINIERTDSVKLLVEYYNLADVYLNLAIEESFGKVSAEALSCGTPIVSMKSTANPELVGEGCGYVLDKKYSIEDIIILINKIKKNGKSYYSNYCRSFALKHFSKSDRINDYINVYNSLLEQ